jgi:hypothetical protein
MRCTGSVTYSATQAISVSPASTYPRSGGGDGWSMALSAADLFNVFRNSSQQRSRVTGRLTPPTVVTTHDCAAWARAWRHSAPGSRTCCGLRERSPRDRRCSAPGWRFACWPWSRKPPRRRRLPRAHYPAARGAGADGRWTGRRRDRPPPGGIGEDRPQQRVDHPHQAARRTPRTGGGARPRRRSRRARVGDRRDHRSRSPDPA